MAKEKLTTKLTRKPMFASLENKNLSHQAFVWGKNFSKTRPFPRFSFTSKKKTAFAPAFPYLRTCRRPWPESCEKKKNFTVLGRADPPRELTWQGEIQSFEDVFPVENSDFPLSCKFIKGVPSNKLNLGRLEYPILNSAHTSSKNVQSPASVMLVDTRV